MHSFLSEQTLESLKRPSVARLGLRSCPAASRRPKDPPALMVRCRCQRGADGNCGAAATDAASAEEITAHNTFLHFFSSSTSITYQHFSELPSFADLATRRSTFSNRHSRFPATSRAIGDALGSSTPREHSLQVRLFICISIRTSQRASRHGSSVAWVAGGPPQSHQRNRCAGRKDLGFQVGVGEGRVWGVSFIVWNWRSLPSTEAMLCGR